MRVRSAEAPMTAMPAGWKSWRKLKGAPPVRWARGGLSAPPAGDHWLEFARVKPPRRPRAAASLSLLGDAERGDEAVDIGRLGRSGGARIDQREDLAAL